jgi:hypothetical protein
MKKHAIKAMPLKNSQIYKLITKMLREYKKKKLKELLSQWESQIHVYSVLWNIIYPGLKLYGLSLITVTWVPISVSNLENGCGKYSCTAKLAIYTQ